MCGGVDDAGGGPAPRAAEPIIKGYFQGGVDVTVSGHAGYWNPEQGLQSICVDAGGRLLVLSFDPVGPETQAIAQKLAEIAIGKM